MKDSINAWPSDVIIRTTSGPNCEKLNTQSVTVNARQNCASLRATLTHMLSHKYALEFSHLRPSRMAHKASKKAEHTLADGITTTGSEARSRHLMVSWIWSVFIELASGHWHC